MAGVAILGMAIFLSAVECDPSWQRKQPGKSVCPEIVRVCAPSDLEIGKHIPVVDSSYLLPRR